VANIGWQAPLGRGCISGGLPALKELHQNHNDSHYEQDMDEPTHGVGRNKSQQPGDDQDESDGVKHGQIVRIFWGFDSTTSHNLKSITRKMSSANLAKVISYRLRALQIICNHQNPITGWRLRPTFLVLSQPGAVHPLSDSLARRVPFHTLCGFPPKLRFCDGLPSSSSA
jgi:hypothetical protein